MEKPPHIAPQGPAARSPRAPLWEVLAAYVPLLVVFKALYLAGGVARTVLDVLVPVAWIYAPVLVLIRTRRDFDAYALTLRDWPRGVRLALAAASVVLPLFCAGYFALHGFGDGRWIASPLRWRFVRDAASQVLVVAYPEEIFFRGYMQTRLNDLFVRRVRVLGTPLSASVVVTSALFAVGHFVIHPDPSRLAVFFPSLVFGWLRERSGSVVASGLFHGLCNVTVLLLEG